jgi:hypothetical protein
VEIVMLCRSYGAYCNVDIDTYKYFAPTEHDLGSPNVKQQATGAMLGLLA